MANKEKKIMSKNKLYNKVALVTGGSNGIGLATVKMLANEGATLIVGYYKGEDRAREVIKHLPGKNHELCQIKLEDPSTSEALAKKVKDKYGSIDIIVNSAGFTKPIAHKDIEKLDIETFDSILLANARGPYSIIRSLMPMLEKSNDAVVINVSSISAFTGSGSNIA